MQRTKVGHKNQGEAMKWFGKGRAKEAQRVKGIELGTKIIHMQFELGGQLAEFYDRCHTHYALGYCFGVYQASLEVVYTDSLKDSDYDAHIREGFCKAFLSEKVGSHNFDQIRRHIDNPECMTGRGNGASEYINIYKGTVDRPYELAQFLLSGMY